MQHTMQDVRFEGEKEYIRKRTNLRIDSKNQNSPLFPIFPPCSPVWSPANAISIE